MKMVENVKDDCMKMGRFPCMVSETLTVNRGCLVLQYFVAMKHVCSKYSVRTIYLEHKETIQ